MRQLFSYHNNITLVFENLILKYKNIIKIYENHKSHKYLIVKYLNIFPYIILFRRKFTPYSYLLEGRDFQALSILPDLLSQGLPSLPVQRV